MKGSLIQYHNLIASKFIWLFGTCAMLLCHANIFGQTHLESPIYSQFGIDSLASIEVQIDELLKLMTLEEKIGQMSQVRHFQDIKEGDIVLKHIGSVIHTQGPTPGTDAYAWQAKFKKLQEEALTSRLGIPLMFAVDAIHGQNTFDGATIFPHNIGMGATGNLNLIKEAASVTAIEAQATGFNWVFSPCVAIPYNERWGRVYEAFSERTDKTCDYVVASVEGHQGELNKKHTVVATAKHFIGDGATEYGIEGGTTSISLKEISSRLLPPYKAAVKAGIGAIMVSFNSVNGISMHTHKALILDTLKSSIGFDGVVVTDWRGYTRFGGNEVINAGIDVVMAVEGDLDHFQSNLKMGVDSNLVSMDRIDDAVRRILRLKFRLDLFSNPFPDTSLVSKIGCIEHRDKAKQAVRESLVLLKHEAGVLPIDSSSQQIVVVGEHADNSGLQSGGWTVAWQGVHNSYSGSTTILEGIQKMTKHEVFYDKEAQFKHPDAEVIIIVVGETPYAEFMGDIRDEEGSQGLHLSLKHRAYIDKYANHGAEIIVVLISGRPMIITDEMEQSDAFIAAWLPGSEGKGVAEVLFGKYNFTGKLQHSWPKSMENYTGKYGPNFWDKSIIPLFEIGYGLEY